MYGTSVWKNDIKYKPVFMFPQQNLACKELMVPCGGHTVNANRDAKDKQTNEWITDE